MEQNQIVIYQTEDGQTQIDVRLENETVWLTQAQMVTLFKSSRTNILEHIQHIYEDDELDESSTCAQGDSPRVHSRVAISILNWKTGAHRLRRCLTISPF